MLLRNLYSQTLLILLIATLLSGLIFPKDVGATIPFPGDFDPKQPFAVPDGQTEPLTKIEPLLLEQLATTDGVDFFVWMKEKADLSPALQLKTKLDKGRFVFETLRQTAERSQQTVRAELDRQGATYRSFYIANKILVRGGSQSLLVNLAARPDVARITANHTFQLEEPQINRRPSSHTLAVETNISFVNADEVWALGVAGAGTVLAGNDTGLNWNHPALINHYRGWNGTIVDHNYNWWDATGAYPTDPADGYGHGTHTTGTMVGDDGGANQIGMAPGSQTIHCKNMTDSGSGSDATFTECFEWDLAPWDLNGANPRPDLAPDAINNSWGYFGGYFPEFEAEITALQAAGILVEASAGNAGPDCATLGSPGDYRYVLTTGSVNHAADTLPGNLTDFSSRGPSGLYPNEYIPDVMAPGENVRSSLPDGTYASWSGTSMAGPHVTGLVGLMWSANPGLRGLVTETMQIILDTSIPLSGQIGSNCGGDYSSGPNNDWGHGTIDALAAVQQAMLYGGTGTLIGTVTDISSSSPLPGTLIQATLISPTLTWQTTSDTLGNYNLKVFSGTHTINASKYGYLPTQLTNISVVSGTTTTLSINLTPAAPQLVNGFVTDATTGWPLYAQMDISAPGYHNTIFTNPETGAYSVSLVEGIPHTFGVKALIAGYDNQTREVTPLPGGGVENFALTADVAACVAPGYSSTNIYLEDFESGFAGWTMTGLWNPENENDTCGRLVAPFPSSSNGAYYGLDGLCAYDTDNTNSGQMSMVAPVTLPPTGNPVLTLQSYEVTECDGDCPWDNRYVEISANGGPWTLLDELGNESEWYRPTFDLTPYLSNDILIRFRFDSVDSSLNGYFGWMVDDVVITTACLPTSGGLAVGNVYDANTGKALNGATVSNDSGGSTTTINTPNDPAVADGFYTLFSPAGPHLFTATKNAYGVDSQTPIVIANGINQQDFSLPAGRLSAPPAGVTVTLTLSQTTVRTLNLTNSGGLAANFNLFEVNAPPPNPLPTGPFAANAQHLPPEHLNDLSALALAAYAPPTAKALATDDVLQTWPSGLAWPWGIGFNTLANDLWLSNIAIAGGDDLDYRFLTDGTNTGQTIDTAPWVSIFAADMTYNLLTGMLWQVNVGGDNCIYELDPATQSPTGNKICPTFGTSERGLAYDPTTDTFYAGSWNDSVINHFDLSGTILDSADIGLAISGLAYNPATSHLFVLTNSAEGLDVYVLDVNNSYAVIGGLNLNGLGAYEQAGLELDCNGHLWAVNQITGQVIEADSGETGVCDWMGISWLSEAPTGSNVSAQGTQPIALTFDASDLAVGTYQTHLRLTDDTPYNAFNIPVTLVVTFPSEPPLPPLPQVYLPFIIKN